MRRLHQRSVRRRIDRERQSDFLRGAICVPEGVAGLWLANKVPSADREMQVSLGALIEAMIAEGMAKGIRNAIATMEVSPNMIAAVSSMEADLIELDRAIKKKHAEGIDFDVFAL
jgi:hypothetical protein